jgi:GTP-binding protein
LIDSAFITVKAGNGGSGKVLFRREAHVPKGGPSGGDGGGGGDVYVVGDDDLNTLDQFRHRKEFKAGDGQDGAEKNMHGSDGPGVEVQVPLGTEVWLSGGAGESALLGEILEDGQKLLVASGGRGGWGNARFAGPTNQGPLLAEAGDEGEVRRLRLDLKLIADVGIIGMPNAGKSSLLAAISSARPKIAGYPFSTLEPVLGVVYPARFGVTGSRRSADERFVAVDIPGLIEGAHEGQGLGIGFLKHVERARVLLHMVDGSADDPAANLHLIDRELREFSPGLAERTQLVVINKLDTPEFQQRQASVEAGVRRAAGPARGVFSISAATGEGLKELVAAVFAAVGRPRPVVATTPATPPEEEVVLRPKPVDDRPNAVLESPGVFRIVHPWAVRLARGSNLADWAVRVQYHARLGHLNVLRDLERLGVRPGDKVFVADKEFVWG